MPGQPRACRFRPLRARASRSRPSVGFSDQRRGFLALMMDAVGFGSLTAKGNIIPLCSLILLITCSSPTAFCCLGLFAPWMDVEGGTAMVASRQRRRVGGRQVVGDRSADGRRRRTGRWGKTRPGALCAAAIDTLGPSASVAQTLCLGHRIESLRLQVLRLPSSMYRQDPPPPLCGLGRHRRHGRRSPYSARARF